jgi:3-hydroxyacyl-CoA dehydrogenase
MGPAMGRPKTAIFRLGDLVGVDIMANVAKNTYALVVDDEARETFKIPDFIEAMVTRGYLGKKSGSGFYKIEKDAQGRRMVKVINPATLAYEAFAKPDFPCLKAAARCKTLPEKLRAMVYGQDRGARFAWRQQAGALIYAANRIPEVADTIVEIDKAMRWGYSFAMGPFETWDAIGVAESVARMEAEGMAVPSKVGAMLAAGHTCFYKEEKGQRLYYDFNTKRYKPITASPNTLSLQQRKAAKGIVKTCPSASLVDLGDGVLCCEFHTKMNALNSELVNFIHASLETTAAEGAGLVFGNQATGGPAAFSAGADLKEMVAAAQGGQFEQITVGIRHMQAAMQAARYAPFPVVAAPYGLTLGGGCEVALGADRMVAHAELYMGLVEVGVGLLPAGGGCLNLWKQLTASLPQGVTGVNQVPLFSAVFQNIAMAKVSTSAADARQLGFMGSRDRIVFNGDTLIGEAKREVLTMLADGYQPPIRRRIKVLGRTAQGLVNTQLADMQRAGFVSTYDAFLAKKIAFVISGGDAAPGSEIDEGVILKLEEENFIALLKEEKTLQRIAHMLKTGKPLRN